MKNRFDLRFLKRRFDAFGGGPEGKRARPPQGSGLAGAAPPQRVQKKLSAVASRVPAEPVCAKEEATTPELVCAKKALDILNCIAALPFDRDTCLRLLDALRTYVLHRLSSHSSTNYAQSNQSEEQAVQMSCLFTTLILGSIREFNP
ncbi:uncharacterized protein LOC109706014 [Ananas comosus]|uniref:Uncharacterized protein LOC109706014 n=1 Tax=Ananas comosus TaxID=4615 RepID=A0A6P5EM04_ANACO|nr:uncharacterized protein LOC109706014 [Ananas comosus]